MSISGAMTIPGLESRRRGVVSVLRRDARLLAMAGLIVLAAGIFALVHGGGSGPSLAPRNPEIRTGSPEHPLSTEALIDSIGVVVHFNYGDTTYGQQAAIVRLLSTLGVRHIRDAVAAPGSLLASGLQAAAQQHITATLAIADVGIDPAQSVGDSLRVLNRSIDAFEGPNEFDNSGNPQWPEVLRAYMPALAADVARMAPGVRLIQPSLLFPASRRLVPSLPGLYNEHPYPLGGPPEPALRKAIAELPAGAIRRGVVFTETGYHNALRSVSGQPPVSEQAAAVYIPRLLVSDFAAGVRSTFIYELADEKPDPGLTDPEEHFGLVRDDLSPKPAFIAIRTLIAALRDSPGAGRPGVEPIHARLSPPDDVSQLSMLRPDGSQVLALWRPVSVWDTNRRRAVNPPPETAELTFDRAARDIVVWRPSVASAPVQRLTGSSRLGLELGGDLVLVSFR